MKLKYAPLPGSFMIFSILGLIISSVYLNSGKIGTIISTITYGKIPAESANLSFGVAFIFLFAVMLIASVLSMTYGPVEDSFALDKRERK